MNELVPDTARAVGFLSRLPVPARYFEGADGRMDRTSRAFALAGVIIAFPAALLASLLLALGVDPLLTAAAAVTGLVILTGALHEDGLADCADGLGGGRDKQQALDIMKDSRIGAYGTIALVLSLILRVAGLVAIAGSLSSTAFACAVLATAAISRAAMVWHWGALSPARSDGVAFGAGKPTTASVRFALGTGGVIGVVLVWLVASVFAVVVAGIATAAVAWGFTAFVRSRISGHTGDTIGATQQLAEIAVLFSLALCL
ncbi:adenosylcobinamide-GDP ribazoletransferase [Hoeflea sp. CAU 1731]